MFLSGKKKKKKKEKTNKKKQKKTKTKKKKTKKKNKTTLGRLHILFMLVLYEFPTSFLYWEANVHPCHLLLFFCPVMPFYIRGASWWWWWGGGLGQMSRRAYVRTPWSGPYPMTLSQDWELTFGCTVCLVSGPLHVIISNARVCTLQSVFAFPLHSDRYDFGFSLRCIDWVRKPLWEPNFLFFLY